MNALKLLFLFPLVVPLGGCALFSPSPPRESTQVAVHSVLPPTHHVEPMHPLMVQVAGLSWEQAEAEWLEALVRFERDGDPLDLTHLGLLTLMCRPNLSRDDRVARLLRSGLEQHSAEGDDDADIVDRLVLIALTQRLDSEAQLRSAHTRHLAVVEQLQSLQGRVQAIEAETGELEKALSAREQENRALVAKLDGERQKVEALRGQLEQLKAIERIIDRREDAGSGQGGGQ